MAALAPARSLVSPSARATPHAATRAVATRRCGVLATRRRIGGNLATRAQDTRSSEQEQQGGKLADDAASQDGDPEKKKYYRTVPGFPGMMVEFDEPEEERVRGERVWWKIVLLCMGVGLMFAQATTFVSLFYV
eukprot:jgi/Tetstr1/438962/TSEL_027455.t2